MATNSLSIKSLDSNSKIRFLISFLLVLIFQLWSTYKGEGVAKTFDSLAYLKAAENLILNQNFIQDRSYVTWALGFPFLLIFFKDSILLNLLCILGSYTFYFDLTQQLVQKSLTKWWLSLAFVFSTPIYLIHHFVWSEPPFLLFLMGSSWAFYSLHDRINNNQIDLKKLFLFCLFGFFLMSMRNAGLYFIVAITSGIILFYILPLFYSTQKIKLLAKLSLVYQNIYFKSLLCFSIASFPSIFMWWLHAKPKTVGTFATMYSLAERTLLEECFNYGDILSRWLVFPSIPLTVRVFLLLVFVILFLILFFNFFIKSLFSTFFYTQHNQNTKFILFLFWITSFYLVGMLISRAGMKVDAERYLAILYPFLCLLIGFVLEKIKINEHLKYGIAFLWLIYPFLRTLKNIIFWN